MQLLNQDLLALCLLAIFSILLLRWHFRSDNQFDLTDLICVDRKLNDKKFIRTGSWAVMTWGFYAMVEDGKLTEWYAGLYGALWVSNALVDKWLRQGGKNEPSA